jgi:hypothetical protein
VNQSFLDGDAHQQGGNAFRSGPDVVKGIDGITVEVSFTRYAAVAQNDDALEIMMWLASQFRVQRL